MTDPKWWTTPFPYKAKIPLYDLEEAQDWLIDRGYAEWRDWNCMYIVNGYQFEFLDKEVHTLFVLRWV